MGATKNIIKIYQYSHWHCKHTIAYNDHNHSMGSRLRLKSEVKVNSVALKQQKSPPVGEPKELIFQGSCFHPLNTKAVYIGFYAIAVSKTVRFRFS